ncbi:MAG: conjugal transfer protein TraA [Gammaproteobacteria bacterium]|nr:conjugal transfer protein TraA [Gammaproteobacteria bacterium]
MQAVATFPGVSLYNRAVSKLDRMFSSKRVIMAAALFTVALLAVLINAHAGAGGVSFTNIAKRIEGWAQGQLGLAIVAGGLIFGVASMVFTGKGTILAVIVGGAVALYYGIPVLITIFAANGGLAIAHTLILGAAGA